MNGGWSPNYDLHYRIPLTCLHGTPTRGPAVPYGRRPGPN